MIENLPQSIEAILFATGEAYTFNNLAKILEVEEVDIMEAIKIFKASLENRGIEIIVLNDEISLVTKPEFAFIIEKLRKEELSKELSKASAETLAVVVYNPGCTRSQIEFIRGVNASYSVRALQMRGLVEQKGTGRAITYQPTLELLESLGVNSLENLPSYKEIKNKIDQLLQNDN